MEKQHNRGQDGAVCKHKLDVEGERYISRTFESCTTYSRCFAQINDRINEEMAAHPEYADDVAFKTKIPYLGELF
jgi:amidophosphoribosyltransferase